MQYPKIEQQLPYRSSDMLKAAFSSAGSFQILVKEDGLVEIRDASGTSVLLVMHFRDFHVGTPAVCDFLQTGHEEG